MRCLIVAVLVLCSGCVDFMGLSKNLPDPFEWAESTNGCLGPWQSASGHKLNGDAIRNNEAILKQLFTHTWDYRVVRDGAYAGDVITHPALLHSAKDFCEHFGGITITYVDADQFACAAEGGQCWGYNDSHGIKLEHTGRSLAHELTHSLELERLIFNTNTHPEWNEKGYYALELLYQAAYDQTVLPTDALALPKR